MDPFVEQLKRLCRAHPTRAKWVFVPAHGIGRTIGDRLVLEGTDWANLRFVTPLDVALRMGAPFLVERGIDPSEEGLGPALVMRLLLGLGDEHEYFRPLAEQPELGRALWSSITELRMAGVRADRIGAATFASIAKRDELQALLVAYEQFLETTKRGDRATVFEEAVKHPDWCPIQPQDCWTELPDAIWTPLERRLIDQMPGERVTPESLTLPGATLPRRLTGAKATRISPDASAPLAFLLDPGGVGTSEPQNLQAEPRHPGTPEPRNQQVSFFQAGGPEAEIEEVFCRVLASGLPLDQVEIVCAQPSLHPLIWEKCLRFDWPVTMVEGIPAAMTRPGRALTAFAEWIDDDFAAGRLRKLLQSGDVELPEGKKKDAVLTPGRAARLLVKAEAAWGRETYGIRLGRLSKVERARADREDIAAEEKERLQQSAEQAEVLATWINAVLATVPAPDADGLVGLDAMVACATTFVQETAAQSSALDAAAATSIAAALGELKALGTFRCKLEHALRFVAERVGSVKVGADRPRPGHLHVSTLRSAAWSSRRAIFVIGLEEGRVFPGAFEDPILLDAERASLNKALAVSSDRVDEAVYSAVARLAAASSRSDTAICLSYSCRDVREFRPTYASWLMLQAFRAAHGKPTAAYSDLREHLGDPKSCVPERATDVLAESRWWLHGLVQAGAAGTPAVLDAYPPLAAGQRAAEARASADFTEFDGHVPEAGKVLDPASPARVVSPTDLEKAAGCPFKYFLERGLNVRAIESGERERDIWLNPLHKGTLLHDAYAELMRRARREKRAVSVKKDHDWLQNYGRTQLADLSKEMPPPSDEVRDREKDEYLNDLELFVEEESGSEAGRVPLGFEVGFGRGGPDPEEPLSHGDPVTVSLGNGVTFRLAGRIDRIDRIAEADFEIIDYKTGSFYAPGWEGTFAGGTRLQHALYGLAALELLKRQHKTARVSGARYRFPSSRGEQHVKEIPTESLAKVTGVLTDLRDVIAGGLFVHTPKKDGCKWCDHELACGGKRTAAQAAGKLAHTSLAPFVRLQGHE
jgi:ATP-dependent helicase/nuclease subunit B